MRFEVGAVASPAAEGSDRVFVGDGRPEPLCVVVVSEAGGRAGEESDAEDAPRTVSVLVRDRERLSRPRVGLVNAAGVQEEGGELGEHPALPPADTDGARHRGTGFDELVGELSVAGVACDGAERPGGLGL
ncbi:MAG TPA: hypothetical protein VMT74_01135, partial [Gaiellaceae bacterium]|nr:hypothetical protein [Gaiellaceae bacterium]